MALTRAPVNGARSVAGPPVIEQRIRVPVWAVLAGWAGRLLARLLVLALVRHSVATAILAGLVAVRVAYGWPALAALLAAVSVGALGWWRLHPASFAVPARWVRGRWRLGWVYRRRWRHVMVGAGLVRRAPTSLGEHIAYTEYLPRIREIRSDGLVDRLRVELLYGQHPDQYARQAEACGTPSALATAPYARNPPASSGSTSPTPTPSPTPSPPSPSRQRPRPWTSRRCH